MASPIRIVLLFIVVSWFFTGQIQCDSTFATENGNLTTTDSTWTDPSTMTTAATSGGLSSETILIIVIVGGTIAFLIFLAFWIVSRLRKSNDEQTSKANRSKRSSLRNVRSSQTSRKRPASSSRQPISTSRAPVSASRAPVSTSRAPVSASPPPPSAKVRRVTNVPVKSARTMSQTSSFKRRRPKVSLDELRQMVTRAKTEV